MLRVPTRPTARSLSLLLALCIVPGLGGCGDDDATVPTGPVEPEPGELPVQTTEELQACVEDVAPSGALLELCLPETWNGEILIWGHGYVNPGPDRPPYTPLALPSDEASGFPVKDVIRNVGTEAAGFFGYAGTSYRRNGLVAPEAADDLVETAAWVREQLEGLAAAEGFERLPAIRYLVGASEGGLATVLAAEEADARSSFDGALALCAPVGDFRRQIEWFGDFRVIYDYYFPGIMPGSAVLIPDEETVVTDENWAATEAAIRQALDANPDAARELADATGVPRDAGDPQTLRDAATQILRYSFMGTNDATGVLGGNPFENLDTVYAGSGDDAALNAGVARHPADAAALAAIEATLQTSGRPTIPTVAMHTARDPVTPIWHTDLYLARNAGAAYPVTVIPVDRFGHCGFSLPELLAGFSQLVVEVRDAPLVTSRDAFPTADMQREFIGLTDVIGSRPVVIPSPR